MIPTIPRSSHSSCSSALWTLAASAGRVGPAAGAGGTAVAAAHEAGGEANLVLPDLSTETFHGINGRTLLMGGLAVCLLGLAFGHDDLHAG